MAAQLLNSEWVSVLEAQPLDKPGYSGPVNLQDCSYWQFSTSTNMLTCWIFLCDLTKEMGPVELARGSHRWDLAARPRELIHGSAEEYLSAAGFNLLSALLPKGGGVFFHGLTSHGSPWQFYGSSQTAVPCIRLPLTATWIDRSSWITTVRTRLRGNARRQIGE